MNISIIEKLMQLDNSFILESLTLLEERYKALYKIGEERENDFEIYKMNSIEKTKNLEENNQLLVEKNKAIESENKSFLEKKKELESQNKSFLEKNEKLESQNKSFLEKNEELESQNKKYFDQNSELQKNHYQLELKYEKCIFDFHNMQEEFEKSAKKLQELKLTSYQNKREIENLQKNSLNNIQLKELNKKYQNNLNQLHLDQEEFEKYFIFANQANILISQQNEQLKEAQKIIKRFLPYLKKKFYFSRTAKVLLGDK